MSVGSLSATFTPPASCLASFSTIIDSGGVLYAGPTTTQSCMPDNFQFSSTNFYSPGICPVGYTTACQYVSVTETVLETVVTCCPTYYICNTNANFAWESTYGCVSKFTSTVLPSLVVVSGTTPAATVVSTLAGAVNAFSVQIRYQSTDFRSSQATLTSTMSLSLSITTVLVASTSSNGGGGGIKPGTAAGIGVGSAAGALLLASAFVFVYFLGRRRRPAENPSALYGLPEQSNVPSNISEGAPELPMLAVAMPEMPGRLA